MGLRPHPGVSYDGLISLWRLVLPEKRTRTPVMFCGTKFAKLGPKNSYDGVLYVLQGSFGLLTRSALPLQKSDGITPTS